MSGEEKMRKYEEKLCETAIPTTRISGSGKVYMEGIGDICISGSGLVSPEEIRINGSGSLPGGIKVRRIRCSGSVSIEGNIDAEEMSISGSASIAGDVATKSFSVSGSFSADGEVKGSLMKTAGSCRTGKGIELEDALHAHGSLKVSGDVKTKNLVELHGYFDIGGKAVTNNFDAELNGRESRVRDGIQARNVSIRKKGAEGLVLFNVPIIGRISRDGKLYTTDITAEERVHLENVSCDNVYGRDVTVSEGCVIKGKVKYSESISVHPNAKLANPPEKSS